MAEWFAPKRYGIGSGLPIAWQGWLVMGLFAAVVTVAALSLGERPTLLSAVVIPATALLLIVCAKTTRGGWRWRWGEKE